tara:strand:+ start:810 stop:1616 length:807 start_codon:yes stop_codon:yes gene_type:complete
MSRIDDTFSELRTKKQTGFIAYVTAGDPDLERSTVILETLGQAAVDIIEVGIPFSDPLADGPAIQRASERALSSGTTLKSSLQMIERVRKRVECPLVLFTYANPVMAMGVGEFMARAADAGVDGLLVLDLPIEEADGTREMAIASNIDPIFLLSPTTTRERIERAAELGRGFLYAISRLGVTGQRDSMDAGVSDMINRIRQVTQRPIALGFGISQPDHVGQVGQLADAAVVGSGLVSRIAEVATSGDMAAEIHRYVQWLKSGLNCRDV